MAGNYVIVANFCDRAGSFFKFQENRHRRKIAVLVHFGSALKPAVFGFGLKTVTALLL